MASKEEILSKYSSLGAKTAQANASTNNTKSFVENDTRSKSDILSKYNVRVSNVNADKIKYYPNNNYIATGLNEDGSFKISKINNSSDLAYHNSNYKSDVANGKSKYEQDNTIIQPKKKSFLDYLADSGMQGDTSLPTGTQTTDILQMQKDKGKTKPIAIEELTNEQLNDYYYLYNKSPEQANNYAKSAINQNRAERLSNIYDNAGKNTGTRLASTVASVATSAISMADYLSQLASVNATGEIDTNTDYSASPTMLTQALRGGVAQGLTDKGLFNTGALSGEINSNIPVIGGASLGTAYQIGTSMMDSLVNAYTQGPIGAVFMGGSAASSAFYDALNRGATQEQALYNGLAQGVAEAVFEYISLDKFVNMNMSETMIKNMLKQGGIEASEEAMTTLANYISDAYIMKDKSEYNALLELYGGNTTKAMLAMANQIAQDALGGFISGGGMTMINTGVMGAIAKKTYGKDVSSLVDESLAINKDNKLATSIKKKLDNNKNVSGVKINRLVSQNETDVYNYDLATITEATEKQLTAYGETDNVKQVASAVAKYVAGEKLTKSEQKAIADSKYGARVANELNPDNIESGNFNTEWAQKLNTNRINPEQYSSLYSDAVNSNEPVTAQNDVPVETDVITKSTPNVETASTQNVTQEAQNTNVEALEETQKPVATNINDVSKKYGAHAKAFVSTYNNGQDVAKYDSAYQRAYEYGASGVPYNTVKGLESISYLTDAQKEIAYETGREASDNKATEKNNSIIEQRNGKTGTPKGTVKLEGKSAKELNQQQRRATRVLRTIAEATGVNVVLFSSEKDSNGNYVGANGRFEHNQPDTIYIDLNSGLLNSYDENDLGKYAMLRTFSHEFVHFVEHWNPIQYNELRKAVFNEITDNGESVDDLIQDRMRKSGIEYEAASREVVAESLTDLLPQASFVQNLAENHKSIFKQLVEKLKAFINNIKAYYNEIGANRSAEAQALKKQIGEAIQYSESIVKLFDNVAEQAVENYQLAYAIDEVTGEVETVEESVQAEEENNPVGELNNPEGKNSTLTEIETETETKSETNITSPNGYSITDGTIDGYYEVAFESKPSQNVLDVLKSYKFRWNKTKKVWYGKVNLDDLQNALDYAYEKENKPSEVKSGPTEIDVGALFNGITNAQGKANTTGETQEVSISDYAKTPEQEVEEAIENDEPVEYSISGLADDEMTFDEYSEAFTSFNEEEKALYNRLTYADTVQIIGNYGYSLNGYTNSVNGKIWEAEINKCIVAGMPVFDANSLYSAKFKSRHNAAVSMVLVARNNKLLPKSENAEVKTETVSENKQSVEVEAQPDVSESKQEIEILDKEETITNDQNENNERAVRESNENGEGTPQLLATVETEPVQGTSSDGRTVPNVTETGRGTGSNSNSEHTETGDSRSAGTSEVGISGDNVLTPEEKEQKDEQLHEIVNTEIKQKSTVKPKGNNFVITESLDLPKGDKARFSANVEAIKLIKTLDSEGRYATPEEQIILSKYVGWGGLDKAFGHYGRNPANGRYETYPVEGWEKEFYEMRQLIVDGVITQQEYDDMSASTKNAHYTSVEVINAMYSGLESMGFNGGRMLEPSCGVGNFVGGMPVSMSNKVNSFTMVELDRITGQIAKYLYPNNDVRIQGFEQANIPNNFIDVAIGNVPFGKFGVVDKSYKNYLTKSIHNYFFVKSIDKVRPCGILMYITSRYTMDSQDSSIREYLMRKADFVGAIRLPDTAFKSNANTSVVTDIIILKKRADGTEYSGEAFAQTVTKNFENEEYYRVYDTNEYFDSHPEMVLGNIERARGMYADNAYTVKAFEDKGTLGEQIISAIKSLNVKIDYNNLPSPEKSNYAVEKANKKPKEGGYVVKEGKLYQNKEGKLSEATGDSNKLERITGLVKIRDAYNELLNSQLQGLDKFQINKARKELNNAYDVFVKKYGYINAPKNKNAMVDMPEEYSLRSLENYDSKSRKATKSDIFTKDTITPNKTITSVETIDEAIIVSINRKGGIDAKFISEITGKSEEEATREMIDNRQAFKTDNGLVAPETYLSGNVRAKLKEAEAMVAYDKDYQNNVDELKKVIPEDIEFNNINVTPGAQWIPNEVYVDFIGHMLNAWSTDKITVSKTITGEYKIDVADKNLKKNFSNKQKWGTNRRSFTDIIDKIMNSGSLTVNDTVELPNGKKRQVLNKEETEALQDKAKEIIDEFKNWVWQDENRKKELVRLYNDTFNNLVNPKYKGTNLTVNGLNPQFGLREHQADAVQRIISSGGNTLLAHKVGAGKTLEMAAAAMKLRELGIVKKPMFVVPKSLVAQWGNEFKSYFPSSKLLVADEKSFTPANRMTNANRIANGDYDAVIVSYEQFEKIPMSKEYMDSYYQAQINEILEAIAESKAEKGKDLTIKQMQATVERIKKKQAELSTKAKDEDNILFESLGVDSIFVDEAHNFKNLFYTTKMNNVSGLGNKDGAQRSTDLYTKVKYLQQLNGGRGIVFATATPVMNSMAEMYIMQRYLQSDALEQLGLRSFDAWAKQFGEIVNGVEIKPSGQGFRVKQSFSNFVNLNELQLQFRSFADVLTDVPGLKIPKMRGGKVITVECELGEYQQQYMKDLEKRADNVKNVDPHEDNMLKITSDGRKISYTQKLIDPSLPYEANCKIFRCCDNIYEEYKNSTDTMVFDEKMGKEVKLLGTQIVFCDMGTPNRNKKPSSKQQTESEDDEEEVSQEAINVYQDMKEYLVQKGIPSNEIAFIHDAKTDAQKANLFDDVNSGKIRVLIGSTGKMGVGMNAQKRVVAIHHLDAPWRPGDVEQRDGRAFRQGNLNSEVAKYAYVSVGSFDARLWDILDRKQHFINQIMNGDDIGRSAEDTGDVSLSAAEVKALASGNPLVKEVVEVEAELNKMAGLKKTYDASIVLAKDKLFKDEQRILQLDKSIDSAKIDIKARVDTYSEGKFSMKINGKAVKDKKDAGVLLASTILEKAKIAELTKVGEFAGFELSVMKLEKEYAGYISGEQNYKFNVYPDNTTYMINHIIGVVEGLDTKLENWQKELENTKSDKASQEELLQQPFKYADKYAELQNRHSEIMAILNPPTEQILGDEETQEQAREYWKPNLSQSEWNLLNSTIENEFYDSTHKLDEITKWLYTEKNGDKVFALYGVGDMSNISESTILYAVGGNLAKENSIKLKKRIKEVENGQNGHNGSGSSFNRWFEAISNVKRKYSLDIDVTRDGRTALVVDRVYDEIQKLNSRGYNASNEDNSEGLLNSENTQYQERTSPMTDREVLTLASSLVENQELTDGERDALRIFQNRLGALEDLQNKRLEAGKLYKEQQFGQNVDRAAAQETLNRIRILDKQIDTSSQQVLDVESKTVLRSVLKKSRAIVETAEKEKGKEALTRYKEKQRNVESVNKYKARIKADTDTLKSWINHPDNKSIYKHVPDVIKDNVISFLVDIDFTSKRQLKGGEATKADLKFEKGLVKLRNTLQKVDSGELYAGYVDLPPYFMEQLDQFIEATRAVVNLREDGFVINNMTAEELKTLSKLVKVLKKTIVQMNTFHNNAMFAHSFQAGDSSIEYMSEINTKEKMSKIGATVNEFVLWQQMRPAYAFERFGSGGVSIYDEFRQGQSRLAFNAIKIKDFAEATYTTEEVKAWEEQTNTVNIDGQKFSIPVSYIMGLYELSKRPQALGHILGAGIRVATHETGKGTKKTVLQDVGHALTLSDLQKIINTLTPRQKEVADKLQQYMQKQGGEWGNFVSVARFGEEQFGEEHYYPINSDGRHLDANADEKPGNASLYALLNMSFTKELQEGANNRIVLYSIFDVFANHMASMAQYNAFALPILDCMKWFNYKQTAEIEGGGTETITSVREQMARVYGTPVESRPGRGSNSYAESFVLGIIKAFNGTETQGIPTDTFGINALHRYNMAAVAYNFRVVVQQPMAITRAGMIVDYSNIIKGMKLKPSEVKQNIDEMYTYSGIAAWKSLGFYDINISRGLTDVIKHKDSFMDKVGDIGMWGAEKADELTWSAIWSACKEQTPRGDLSEKEYFKKVATLFEEVIYKTQVVDSVLTKNEYLRSKGAMARMLGSFMSEPTTTASMVVDAYDKFSTDMQRGMTFQQAWKVNRGYIVKTAYVYAIGATMLSAVQAVLDAWRDDDDYQTFMQKWLEQFKGNLVDEFLPFNKLPILSQVYDWAKRILKVFGVDTYGNNPRTVILQWGDAAVEGTQIIMDHINGKDTNYEVYGGVFKLLQAISGATGIPLASVTREVVSGWNNTAGALAPSLKVKSYDEGEASNIKYAWQDGYINDDKAMSLLVEKGVADDENDAYWYLQRWGNGESINYFKIYDAMKTGEGFSDAYTEMVQNGYEAKQINTQIKKKIRAWYLGTDKEPASINRTEAAQMLVKYGKLAPSEAQKLLGKWDKS